MKSLLSLIRPIGTPLTIFTSAVVFSSGLFMFFAFKNKFIEDLHAQIGLLLTVGLILHLIINWKPMVNHLKKSRSYLTIVPIAIIAVILTFGGEKKPGISPGMVMGKLEQAKMATVAELFSIEQSTVIAALSEKGLSVKSEMDTIKDIAVQNQKKPREVLAVIASLAKKGQP